MAAARKGTRTVSRRSPDKKAPTFKSKLARIVALDIAARELTQLEAGRLMNGTAPSQVSLVVTGTLDGFSLERLMGMVGALGYDITMNVRKVGTGNGRLLFKTET